MQECLYHRRRATVAGKYQYTDWLTSLWIGVSGGGCYDWANSSAVSISTNVLSATNAMDDARLAGNVNILASFPNSTASKETNNRLSMFLDHNCRS